MGKIRSQNSVVNRPKARQSSAFSLVEALVALVLSSLISAIVLDFFGQLLRTNSATQNEAYANAAINNMTESANILGYNYFAQHIGQTFGFSEDTLNNPNASYHPHTDALLLDLKNLDWNPKSKNSRFRGSASCSIAQAPGLANAIKVSYSVQWADSARKQRTITSSQIFTRDGRNRWTQ